MKGNDTMRTIAVMLGLIGAFAGILAAGYAFVIYMVEGTNGMANPYAARVGFGVAAFLLAGVAGLGALLVWRRPEVGSLLLMLGSILGFVAINLFNINTWYILTVPLCLLAALLALDTAAPSPVTTGLRIGSLALLIAMTVAAYFVAGTLVAAAHVVLVLVALALVMRHITSNRSDVALRD